MKLPVKIFLTIILWICLPVVLMAYFRLTMSSPLAKPVILFTLYMCFSWSIALLAFVMGSARQQLFEPPPAHQTALRLALYGLFAVVLAILTSPWLTVSSKGEMLQTGSVVFIYCYAAGLFYWVMFIKPGKQID